MKFAIVAVEQTPEQGATGYLLHGCSVADILHGIRLMSDGGIVLGPLVASRVAERMKQRVRLTSRELDILRHVSLAGIGNGKPPSPSAPRHF
jgi:DNA-binding NarL/FixJ family response regulator